jgi:hypothetical protein
VVADSVAAFAFPRLTGIRETVRRPAWRGAPYKTDRRVARDGVATRAADPTLTRAARSALLHV